MKDLIIFGNGKIADVVFYYAKNECNYNVVSFTVDRKFIGENRFHNLPVIPFEEIKDHYKPADYSIFIATGYQDLNRLREAKYLAAKELGYEIVSIVSPGSKIPSSVKHGENCFIMPPAIIHPAVEIGNNTFVWSGAMIGHHSRIGNNCWLTSCTNISGVVKVGNNCFFAVNSTVGHGVNIGNECFLGANTLVTKNLADKKVVIEESSKVFRLESEQFLRFSKFTDL
ncbi:MAG: acetyltransferase [Bacteroidales bacterium]|jgi:sugar O-acyltransferase (sialic acid O-acetyltransferase NeuD family)|nr:acetyltransferase [Bacteroidales bacterium]